MIPGSIKKSVGKGDREGKEVNEGVHFIEQNTAVSSSSSILLSSTRGHVVHASEISCIRGEGAGIFIFQFPSVIA